MEFLGDGVIESLFVFNSSEFVRREAERLGREDDDCDADLGGGDVDDDDGGHDVLHNDVFGDDVHGGIVDVPDGDDGVAGPDDGPHELGHGGGHEDPFERVEPGRGQLGRVRRDRLQ